MYASLLFQTSEQYCVLRIMEWEDSSTTSDSSYPDPTSTAPVELTSIMHESENDEVLPMVYPIVLGFGKSAGHRNTPPYQQQQSMPFPEEYMEIDELCDDLFPSTSLKMLMSTPEKSARAGTKKTAEIAPDVCMDYLGGVCRNCKSCPQYHCGDKYQWQKYDTMRKCWLELTLEENHQVEKSYCNPASEDSNAAGLSAK